MLAFPAQKYPYQAPPGIKGASGESSLITCEDVVPTMFPPQTMPPELFASSNTITFAEFESHYQYCKRCTEQKYRKSCVAKVEEV